MVTITQKQFNELSEKVDFLIKIIDKLGIGNTAQGKDDEIKWYDTPDEKVFRSCGDKIVIKSNLDTWSKIKKSNETEVFYIGAHNKSSEQNIFFGMTIRQAIELRDYLTHKIDYLTSTDEGNENEIDDLF